MKKAEPKELSICTTCYEHVEFRYDKDSKAWISYDYGTDRLHECGRTG